MKTLLLLALLAIAARSRAEILLPPQFASNMVLQRGALNRIWGARAGAEKIWIEFRPGIPLSKKFKADTANLEKENWDYVIDLRAVTPDQAAAPGMILFWEGKKPADPPSLILTNILIGDVWILALPARNGMIGPPTNPVPCRLLDLANPADLARPSRAQTAWDPAPQQYHILSSAFAFQLYAGRQQRGYPIGIVQIPAELADEFFKTHLATRRTQESLADFQQIQKLLLEASRSSNKRIDAEAAKIEQTLIASKHSDTVAPFQHFRTYGALQAAPAAKLKQPLLHFEGALHPAAP